MNNKVITIVIILTLGILVFGIIMLAKNSEPSNDVKINNNAETTNTAERKETTVSSTQTYTSAPVMQINVNKTYTATMETSKGNMEFKLFTNETPVTVNNFVFLSKENFYNGTKFHRIIKDFIYRYTFHNLEDLISYQLKTFPDMDKKMRELYPILINKYSYNFPLKLTEKSTFRIIKGV